jgi:hypothetical protein
MNDKLRNRFTPEDIRLMSVPMKVGILGTLNEAGQPHLTMISTLQPGSSQQVIWGQFTEGSSKRYIQSHPEAGFLIMTLDKHLWRGKARFTHTANAGPEYEMYNNVPMFRYNAYFGVHTVYYMDLIEHSGRQALPMGRVAVAAVQTRLASALRSGASDKPVLNMWTRALFNKLDNLKFLGYVGPDGYPAILPLVQAQAADSEHILFSLGAYGSELSALPQGEAVAVFGMTLDMEDVLVRGVYQGVRRIAGIACGQVQVDWVYNSMPPVPGQIYPPLDLHPVREFEVG